VAQAHLGMALECRKKTLGIVDPEMASTMSYIATIAASEGEFDKSIFFARQVRTWCIVVAALLPCTCIDAFDCRITAS